MSGGVTISSYLIFGFLLIPCMAKDYQNYQTPENISCYECNSLYDPRCKDPFDNYTIGYVNCSLKAAPEQLGPIKPVLCRKIISKVEGVLQVVRGCGYIRDSHDDKACFRRTGTSNIDIVYCSCTTPLCNGAESLPRPIFAVILSTVAIKLAITCLFDNLHSP